MPKKKDEKNGVKIECLFYAPREIIWQAWTTPEMVKKWWGPKNFWAPFIKIDFRKGGKYLYAMHGPKGTKFDQDMYSGGSYKEIVPLEKIVVTDYFSDEKGNKVDPAKFGMDKDFPKEMDVVVTFQKGEADNTTKLIIEYPRPASDAEFVAMKKSGMETGWSESLDKLAKSLVTA